jgi:hypothetical protein
VIAHHTRTLWKSPRDVLKGVVGRQLFSPSSSEKGIVATDEDAGVLVASQEPVVAQGHCQLHSIVGSERVVLCQTCRSLKVLCYQGYDCIALDKLAKRIGKINGIFASPPAPPTSASGRPARAALAAPPARRGGLQKRRAARRGAAMRGLDMRLRLGYAEDARVCRFGGLGTARWGKLGGPISNGIARRKGVR